MFIVCFLLPECKLNKGKDFYLVLFTVMSSGVRRKPGTESLQNTYLHTEWIFKHTLHQHSSICAKEKLTKNHQLVPGGPHLNINTMMTTFNYSCGKSRDSFTLVLLIFVAIKVKGMSLNLNKEGNISLNVLFYDDLTS